MSLALALTSILLAVGSLFDGKSTVDFLTKGKGAFVEGDPVMVFFFGSDNPSSKRVWITGALVISAEIGIAFLGSHLWHPAIWFFYAQQVIQAGVHFFLWHRNEGVLVTYLKSVQK